MITISIGRVQSDGFEKEFYAKLRLALLERYGRAADIVSNRLSGIVETQIRQSYEADVITRGRVRNELGLLHPERIIEDLIDRIVEFAEVVIDPPMPGDHTLQSSIKVALLRKDLIEALNVEGASFTSENGFDVPWMKWTLLDGSESEVLGYHYRHISSPKSRTGTGVMVKNPTDSWSPPGEFQGVQGDNWLIRALNGIGDEIGKTLIKALQK